MKFICTLIALQLCYVIAVAQTPVEQQALELVKVGKNKEALAAFEQIIVQNPANADALNALAQLYLRTGQFNKAYQTAAKGLAIKPGDVNFVITKAKAAIGMGKADEAIILADGLIANEPGFFLPYAIKGNALDAQNKIQLAIGQYSKSIQLNPEYQTNYLDRGNDFMAISRYGQAVADYDKLLALDSENGEAYNMRGMANYRLGKPEQAIADYTKAIQLNNLYALADRGIVYREKGSPDLALIDFNRSVTELPNVSDGYYQRAALYADRKQYAAGIPDIQKAIAIDKNRPHYYALYSKMLMQVERDEEALLQADKILAIDKLNPDGFFLKGTALSNLKRFDEAVTIIGQGISIYPENYLFYQLRSFVYKQMGKTQLADADFKKAQLLSSKTN